ncbi:MAG TPA: guanylate kinase [Chloroflexia bacterium]|nr:guanylate kinase [Chloroflexia bacterium]
MSPQEEQDGKGSKAEKRRGDDGVGRAPAGEVQASPQGEPIEEVLADLVAAGHDVPEIEQYVERPPSALLVVLTGPSGVGKDRALERMRELAVPFHYVVTVTTRPIREGEVDGRHYFFVTREEYGRMLAKGELLEHAEVYGNYYGIPRSEVIEPLRGGVDVIMKPDVQGAATMRQIEPEAVFIFLAPPSMEELAARLYYRKTEDRQELARRLAVAADEMAAVRDFDYIVVNHHKRLDETVAAIQAIIEAEKCRVQRRQLRLLNGENDPAK